MRQLTSIQQYVIDYIIAENEETETLNPLTPYMQALNGDFKGTISLCNKKSAGLILYVRDAEQDTSEQFISRCVLLKKDLLEIAECIADMVMC